MDFKRGDQIVYIPLHANGDKAHPDCEFGFVTSVRPSGCFCRYWHKGSPGSLRTRANSEYTDKENLEHFRSVSQDLVDTILEQL